MSNVSLVISDVDGTLLPFRYREEPMTALVWRAAAPFTALIGVASALGLVCMQSSRRWRV